MWIPFPNVSSIPFSSSSYILTSRHILCKDGLVILGQGTVPPSVAELEATLLHGLLCTFSDGHYGIWPPLADGPLPGSQTGYAVADYVGSECHHRRKGPVVSRKTMGIIRNGEKVSSLSSIWII